MKSIYNTPLTDDEQKFAEENAGLAFKFLNKFNGYADEDKYDCVIHGYILSVKKYLNNERLREYKFGTICQRTIFNFIQKMKIERLKRNKLISENYFKTYNLNSEKVDLFENIPDNEDCFENVFYTDLYKRIMNILTNEERIILDYVIDGHTQREIGKNLNFSYQWISYKIKRIREKITEMMNECQE